MKDILFNLHKFAGNNRGVIPGCIICSKYCVFFLFFLPESVHLNCSPSLAFTPLVQNCWGISRDRSVIKIFFIVQYVTIIIPIKHKWHTLVFNLNLKFFLICQGNPIIWRFQIIIKENSVFCNRECYFIVKTLFQWYMYLFETGKKSPSSIIIFVPRNGSCFLDSTPHTRHVTSFWRRPPKIAVTIVLLPFGPMKGLSLFG